MDLVWNRAPWTRVRIADLVDAIQQVEALTGGKRLIDRYTRADQQSGALFELDLAATAFRKDLTVELEPQTQPGRTSDMAIAELRGRGTHTVFVEVQSIQDFGDETKRALAVVERLAPTLAWVMSGRELLGVSTGSLLRQTWPTYSRKRTRSGSDVSHQANQSTFGSTT